MKMLKRWHVSTKTAGYAAKKRGGGQIRQEKMRGVRGAAGREVAAVVAVSEGKEVPFREVACDARKKPRKCRTLTAVPRRYFQENAQFTNARPAGCHRHTSCHAAHACQPHTDTPANTG